MASSADLPLRLINFAAACAESLDQLLADSAASDTFSGVIQLARLGHPFLTRAVGFAHRDFTIPNAPSTKFNMGSLGKMMTAIAVAQLVEAGSITFYDPVAPHLPVDIGEFPASITIHHLLTHTAGLPDVFAERYFATPKNYLRSDRALLQLLPKLAPQTKPSETWLYSNAGYLLLGCLIEQITRQRYHQYIQEAIFTVLGMSETSFSELDEPLANRAVGYTKRGTNGQITEGPWRANFYLAPVAGGAAGGAYTTVADMTRFAAAVQERLLLQPDTWAALLTKHVQVNTASWYGYGFDVDLSTGVQIIGHEGGVPGFDARLEIVPTTGLSMVVFANYDRPAAQHIVDRLRPYLTTVVTDESSC